MGNDSVSAIMETFRGLPDFPAFEAFSRALWRNEAAVMVGAGFSRVCAREPDSPVPPLWETFQAAMRAALGYSKEASPDALRLAQEYQILHGENGMDELVRRLVADGQWQPGPLHKQLMEFPWRDVLTTNWDTLLERTKPQTPDRIYSCVRTVQDIANQPSPRIVKLHGSMPSHKPFIITEDDYRTYPVRYAPFVNLAQQVMLEHDVCLIGFSGIDPNFLAWSGWVRDTLNVSARRIRLVGVLKLSQVSRTVLERRNVTPIDLAPLVSDVHPDEQHEKALRLFFSALSAFKPPSPYIWIRNSEKFSQSAVAKDKEKPTRAEVAAFWADERFRYPGWIVAPSREVAYLGHNSPHLRNSNDPADAYLRFCAERIWRDRAAGIWLNRQDIVDADTYFEVAERLLPQQQKIELCVSIAGELRRFRQWDDWERWLVRLGNIGGNEATLHHAYEKGQRAVLDWDDDAVLSAANALKSDEPIWMMRRAGLLAALFHDKEAAELYEAALFSVRHKLLSNPKSAWLISLEGWAAMFHRVSKAALTDDPFVLPERETDETTMRFAAAKADPWDIISRLETLASDRIERNRSDAQQWKLSFKSGQFSLGGTIRLGGDSQCPFYGLLDVIERVGAPDHIANTNLFSTRLSTAYRAIKNPDEDDLLTFFARYRGSDKNILDWMMSRMQVARLSDAAVGNFLSVISRRVEKLLNNNGVFRPEGYLVFLLKLLARVIVRASTVQALALFEWVIDLLNSSVSSWRIYTACGEVLESAVEAMEADERQKAMALALQMKTPGEVGAMGIERDWPEIFEIFSETDGEKFEVSVLNAIRIDALLVLVKNGAKIDRGRAIRRLHTLYQAEKLSADQITALESAIWGRCGEVGWPSDTDLYPWIFLELPGKSRAETLFIEHVVGGVAKGEISSEMLLNLRLGLERLDAIVPTEAVISCVKKCVTWQPNSVQRENAVFPHFWTDNGEDQAIAREIGEVLGRSLLPRLKADDIPNDVAELLSEPYTLQHIISLAAASYELSRLWPDKQGAALKIIRYALASREPARVYSTFAAMKNFIRKPSTRNDIRMEIKNILLHICEQRTQPGLAPSLNLLAQMMERGQLDAGDIERLTSSLPHILIEYSYDQINLEVPAMAELPRVRRELHLLSTMLEKFDPQVASIKSALDRDPLPEVRVLN
ncbi:SIR2 family protein [Ciceribacter sp. L1K22]|uniref:SIR2 family protein n=1 Tax=Ciceribacter sp. L1K22 TaxID=2820275 RepID=UPI001ABEDEEA|nr:SIR2 family protein [Ciceribacter sp. L1K22]MBO3760458.1 SIR2 family protein [Ciceribacter sp. L1K22]